jgi:5-methylcytosine-specific restriction enzyme A
MIFFSDRSPLWRKVRSEHIKQQPLCQACGSKKSLEVHHIEPYHLNLDRELDPANLITLCKTCHFVFGHLMDYKSWNIDVVADSKIQYNKVTNRPYHEKLSGTNAVNNSFIHTIIGWYKRSFNSR